MTRRTRQSRTPLKGAEGSAVSQEQEGLETKQEEEPSSCSGVCTGVPSSTEAGTSSCSSVPQTEALPWPDQAMHLEHLVRGSISVTDFILLSQSDASSDKE